jgi:hypothetical protein
MSNSGPWVFLGDVDSDPSRPGEDAGTGTPNGSRGAWQAGSVTFEPSNREFSTAEARPGPVARPAVVEVELELYEIPAGILMLLLGPWTWKNWYMAELTDAMRWEDDGGPVVDTDGQQNG